MTSSCTLALWADDTEYWPLARDGWASITASYVDENWNIHLLLRARSGNLYQLTTAMPNGPFSVCWVQRDDVTLVTGGSESTWLTESRIPMTLVEAPDPVVLNDLARRSVMNDARPTRPGDGTLESYFATHATTNGDEIMLLLDPERHTVINGEVFVFRSAVGKWSRLHLPLLPIRWGSLNAIGHVAATPACVVVDVVLSPVYLVMIGLEAAGMVRTH